MPETKKSLVRLVEIDRLLHNHPEGIRVRDIKSHITTAVSDRTIQMDIKILKESASNDGFDAPIEEFREGRERYYKYRDPHFSIFSPPLNDEEKRVLKELFGVLSRFENIVGKDWLEVLKYDIDGVGFSEDTQCVEFEETEDVLFSDKLHKIYDLIIQKSAVVMSYKPYAKQAYSITVFPYYLKQFNRRWFLIARTQGFDTLSVYSLDRIEKVKKALNVVFEDTYINFKEYFEDIIGVTLKEDKPIEKIVLAVKNEHYPYVESKPIHSTQRMLSKYSNEKFPSGKYTFIELKVIQNKELIARILEYGNRLFVVEPTTLYKEIADIVAEQNQIYN